MGWGNSPALSVETWEHVVRGASRCLYISQITFTSPPGSAAVQPSAEEEPVELEVVDPTTSSAEVLNEADDLVATAVVVQQTADASASNATDAKSKPSSSSASASDGKQAPAPTPFSVQALYRKLSTDLVVFGSMELITIYPRKSCAVVSFSTLQSAVRALSSLSRLDSSGSSPNTEIYSKVWRLGYCKDRCALTWPVAPSASASPTGTSAAATATNTSPAPQKQK
jgi:hypothetical protein